MRYLLYILLALILASCVTRKKCENRFGPCGNIFEEREKELMDKIVELEGRKVYLPVDSTLIADMAYQEFLVSMKKQLNGLEVDEQGRPYINVPPETLLVKGGKEIVRETRWKDRIVYVDSSKYVRKYYNAIIKDINRNKKDTEKNLRKQIKDLQKANGNLIEKGKPRKSTWQEIKEVGMWVGILIAIIAIVALLKGIKSFFKW